VLGVALGIVQRFKDMILRVYHDGQRRTTHDIDIDIDVNVRTAKQQTFN